MSEPAAGRVVLMTGAGGGIGATCAREFARRGDCVAICDIDAAAATATAAAIVAEGGRASAHSADIGNAAQVDSLFDEVLARWDRIDIAFNNAGVSGGRKPLADIEEAEWDHCLQTNLKGTWLCMRREIRLMLSQGGGIIINNASVTGLIGSTGTAYCASKHGIVGLTRSAALTYASQGVRINAVCPGLIDAGLGGKLIARIGKDSPELLASIPAKRAGTADEVAKAVWWLASDDASFVQGHMLTVDGGFTIN